MNAKTTLAILIASLGLPLLAACEQKKDDMTRMSDATQQPPPATAPAAPDKAETPPLPSGTPLPAPAPETPATTPEPPKTPQ